MSGLDPHGPMSREAGKGDCHPSRRVRAASGPHAAAPPTRSTQPHPSRLRGGAACKSLPRACPPAFRPCARRTARRHAPSPAPTVRAAPRPSPSPLALAWPQGHLRPNGHATVRCPRGGVFGGCTCRDYPFPSWLPSAPPAPAPSPAPRLARRASGEAGPTGAGHAIGSAHAIGESTHPRTHSRMDALAPSPGRLSQRLREARAGQPPLLWRRSTAGTIVRQSLCEPLHLHAPHHGLPLPILLALTPPPARPRRSTNKALTGPDLGLPCLTFQSYYEVRCEPDRATACCPVRCRVRAPAALRATSQHLRPTPLPALSGQVRLGRVAAAGQDPAPRV